MRELKINVAGQTFKIKSDAEEKYLRDLATDVTKRFRSLKKSSGRAEQDFQVMSMVAIAFLDELNSSKERSERIRDRTRVLISTMIESIDNLLNRKL
jgi:cell division protein ZapA (FtsZ GTPase activity inhibitor)